MNYRIVACLVDVHVHCPARRSYGTLAAYDYHICSLLARCH